MKACVGGKSGAGVWQRIINQIPPCEVFVSGFLGNCAVMRRLRLPRVAIGIDADLDVIEQWRRNQKAVRSNAITLLHGCCLDWLKSFFVHMDEPAGVLVYLDPPYMLGPRGGRLYYRHELSDDQHGQLAEIVATLPCRVLLNHPRCELYDAALGGWRRVEYRAMTRGGKLMDDCLWANYPEPDELQDYRFVGRNKRQRERIRRRCRNWVASLKRMGTHERGAMLAAVAAEFGGR